MRAAVRCAAPMPSPSSRMMFARARRAPRPRPQLDGQPRVAVAPSAVRASMTSGPGRGDAEAAQQEVGRVRRGAAARCWCAAAPGGRPGAARPALTVRARRLEHVPRGDVDGR